MTNENAKAIEVERAARKLLDVLEDAGATPEDETRAALDLRRALGERPDPFAVLHAAEEAVIIAGGWTRDGDRWKHATKGRETHRCALATELYHHEHPAIAVGGAS